MGGGGRLMDGRNGFKLVGAHTEDCYCANDPDYGTVFIVHDRTEYSSFDRIGRRNAQGGTTWHFFRCNDGDCEAQMAVRWDVLARFVSSGGVA
jgi:hypothetical protein